MIALILMTCSMAGGDCSYSVVNDHLTPMACMIGSMTEPAHFLAEHPNRIFRKAICTRAERIQVYLGGRAA